VDRIHLNKRWVYWQICVRNFWIPYKAEKFLAVIRVVSFLKITCWN